MKRYAVIAAALAVNVAGFAGASTGAKHDPPPPGIHKIRHVVLIMQENRSFDSYFGTYPGRTESRPASAFPIR